MLKLEILGLVLYSDLYNTTLCSIVLLLTGILGCLLFSQMYKKVENQSQKIGDQLLKSRAVNTDGSGILSKS